MNIEQYGFDKNMIPDYDDYLEKGYHPARVCVVHKGAYTLISEFGELAGEVSGKFLYNASSEADYPAVGDWVMVKVMQEEGKAVIHSVLPRKTKFSRKVSGITTNEQIIATNIDYVFIVVSLNNNFSLERIERYLVMAWESGAAPVIILSKADLCEDIEEYIREAKAAAAGIPVHAISVVTGYGLEPLRQYFKDGSTVAFLGSSGVGKSTLINYFMGTEKQKVQSINESFEKGRHTTTHRELMRLPEGGLMIDTPGMRELQLWEATQGVSDTFEYIEDLAKQCKFSDCKHMSEPGCAVKAALSDGTLSAERFDNYKKLQRENEHLRVKLLYNDIKKRKGMGKKPQK